MVSKVPECGTSADGGSLTAAAYRRQVDQTPHPEPSVRRRPTRVFFLAVAFTACELSGMAAVVLAYSIALTTVSNESEFAFFWVGMFLLEAPLVGLIARRATSRPLRAALLTFYGLVSLHRNCSETRHHRYIMTNLHTGVQPYDILNTGKLFQPDPIISDRLRVSGPARDNRRTGSRYRTFHLAISTPAADTPPCHASTRHRRFGPVPRLDRPDCLAHSYPLLPQFFVSCTSTPSCL